MNLKLVRVVMVNPLYGGNVGSVCRAMANMGVEDLALVTPVRLDLDEARKMACHATGILEARQTFDRLEDAIADCSLVFATTARGGLYRCHASTPREAAAGILAATATGRAAIVFGREDRGLTNDELMLCSHVIQIPTTVEYASLNVAQASLICLYEIFVASGVYEPPREKSPEATSELRERMFGIWRETLMQIGFMDDEKADHMMQGFRRIMARGALTVDDVHIMMGVARQSQWAASGRIGTPCRQAIEPGD